MKRPTVAIASSCPLLETTFTSSLVEKLDDLQTTPGRRFLFYKISQICFVVVACTLCVKFFLPGRAATGNRSESSDRKVVGEEIFETGFSQAIEVSRLLFNSKSKYQTIQVYEAAKIFYGRVLVLDGVLQLAEGDAAAYNEMMAHMALFHHPNPRRVLVIGGGDGYVVSEVLKHKSVEIVDHVDLDGEVVIVCRRYFPQWDKWSDPRVNLHITDGATYCQEYANQGNQTYDVVIQDSSDPWSGDDETKIPLPSGVLYTQKHLNNIHRLLDPGNGVLVFQAEMIYIPSDLDGAAEWRKSALEAGFARSRYGSIMISSYPTGQIGFMLCENSPSPTQTRERIEQRFQEMNTEYFHPDLMEASLVLPLWAQKAIYGNTLYAHKQVHNTSVAIVPNGMETSCVDVQEPTLLISPV